MLVHLLSIFQIILSITLLVVHIAYLNYSNIEPRLNISYCELSTIYKLTFITNTMMSLYSVCCIYTKRKLYMKFYIFINFFSLVMMLLFILYCRFIYIGHFSKAAGLLSISLELRTQVQNGFGCGEDVNDCITILRRNVEELIKFYLIFGISLFIIDFIIFVLIKISLSVPIYQTPKPLPKIHKNERVGFGTASLRAKRVIEPDFSPDNSLTELDSSFEPILSRYMVNENEIRH
ncbi:hypothetical protein DMUE_2004 [Dictyocoela muelleri]|nr:hypothetical protein DMUE_2004 [Dictyocoela muelleri]